jgi:hypothetical protein
MHSTAQRRSGTTTYQNTRGARGGGESCSTAKGRSLTRGGIAKGSAGLGAVQRRRPAAAPTPQRPLSPPPSRRETCPCPGSWSTLKHRESDTALAPAGSAPAPCGCARGPVVIVSGPLATAQHRWETAFPLAWRDTLLVANERLIAPSVMGDCLPSFCAGPRRAGIGRSMIQCIQCDSGVPSPHRRPTRCIFSRCRGAGRAPWAMLATRACASFHLAN